MNIRCSYTLWDKKFLQLVINERLSIQYKVYILIKFKKEIFTKFCKRGNR